MAPKPPDNGKNILAGNGGRLLILAGCLVMGAALRYRACRTEFWHDEIWSLLFVQKRIKHGAWDILFNLRHDNNHILNSLYLYCVGNTRNWFWYRLPALLSGIGSIVLAFFCGRPKSGWAGVLAAFLTAFSFPLILYSSEARGYGPAIFFSLLAFYALQEYFDGGRRRWLVLFNLAAALAAFSHISFIYVYLAAAFWSAAKVLDNAMSGRETAPTGIKVNLTRFAAINAFPCLVFIFLYFSYLNGLKIGGGPQLTIPRAAGEASTLALGTPRDGLFWVPALAAVMGLSLGGVIKLWREKNDLWVFYFSALILAPALVIGTARPKIIYFRYFIVLTPFFYLLCAGLFDGLRQHSGKGRILAAGLLLLFLLGQSTYIVRFFHAGRGAYATALSFMADNTAGDQIVAGSDNDNENSRILLYYSQFLRQGKNLFYIPAENLAKQPPDWFIMEVAEPGTTPATAIKIVGATRYRLAGIYRYSGFSGCDWFLYRRISSP